MAEETKRTVDHGVRQRLRLKGRGFYGLGQHPGTFNYADREVTLVQRNGEIALPVLVSDGGVGIVWDVYSLSRVKVGRPEGGFATVDFQAEDVDGFVYYVIYGPDPKRVVSTYWKLTGEYLYCPGGPSATGSRRKGTRRSTNCSRWWLSSGGGRYP
ncbi:hypothetical protein HS1genome_1676 [Sulfodiicoccus acidiphilus]|uniref:Uncharacterized protein n=1 Tax=Sulfodiicoccus acidiphilus TaxID=1670455 RepID=A0A348B535_9CREN|nr:hypothetical protein [Sulfodiicoccus acidiphilus]BBD73287.1 hypothetical protein HS1genome_1676 [Sulfodiicoccus acidiphilus]